MTKNYIPIKDTEKKLYRIFKELEKYGRSSYSYPKKEHQSISRKIGIRVKPFVEKKMILPPLSSTNKHQLSGIQLPINIGIKEKKKGVFVFYRKKLL